jgi:hypothetical protein
MIGLDGASAAVGSRGVTVEVPPPPDALNINPLVAGVFEVSNMEGVADSSFFAAPNIEPPNIDVVGTMSVLTNAA